MKKITRTEAMRAVVDRTDRATKLVRQFFEGIEVNTKAIEMFFGPLKAPDIGFVPLMTAPGKDLRNYRCYTVMELEMIRLKEWKKEAIKRWPISCPVCGNRKVNKQYDHVWCNYCGYSTKRAGR